MDFGCSKNRQILKMGFKAYAMQSIILAMVRLLLQKKVQ